MCLLQNGRCQIKTNSAAITCIETSLRYYIPFIGAEETKIFPHSSSKRTIAEFFCSGLMRFLTRRATLFVNNAGCHLICTRNVHCEFISSPWNANPKSRILALSSQFRVSVFVCSLFLKKRFFSASQMSTCLWRKSIIVWPRKLFSRNGLF